MQLVDRPPIPTPVVMNAAAQPISGSNQKTYARLKMSLQLNLRRQIFLAVCDDLELRNQLVNKLQAELSPHFVSLNLNLADPNPMAQASQWLNHRRKELDGQRSPSPGFQILGIEHLTRQPAPVQKRFLTHLQAIEYYMPTLECTLLLWVPRPWLGSIRQSAPTFWEWHTALFEFEGDPTPVRSSQSTRSPVASPVTRLQLAKIEPWLGSTMTTPPPPPRSEPRQPSNDHPQVIAADLDSGEIEDAALLHDNDYFPEAVWDILTQDLAQWQEEETEGRRQRQEAGSEKDRGDIQNSKFGSADSPEAKIQNSLIPQSAISNPQSATPSPNPQPPTPTSTNSLLKQRILAALEEAPQSEQHQFGLAALQRIEQLQEQQIPANALAAAYYALGRAYRECIEQGDSSDHTLTTAIAAHEQTIAILEEDAALGADVANDLGNLYWMRSRHAVEADVQLSSLEQAIQAYKTALAQTNPREHPKTCAMIQNNLGSAYGDLAQHQAPAENLQKSVQAYHAALQLRSATEEPARYAATQNNLGTACWNLAQHQQPIVHLKQAIAAYEAALQYYTPDNEPLSYAMIQNNVGTAYWNLAQHVQPGKSHLATTGVSPDVLLQLAIAAYQKALVYRTLQAAPLAYAATQNNLGTAYWDLANLAKIAPKDRQERLQSAITAYEAAIAAVDVLTLQSSQHPALTFDVFATYNNLGLAYYQRATDPKNNLTAKERRAHLEAALKNHLKSLQGWENLTNLQQSTLDFIVQTVRAFFNEFGIEGQSFALSQIPPSLLPEIMSKL
ncbi:MAG: tetratricopeptide repeat protein [Oscillatoriales cyanobacterium C42_A2020_001]|nr:tetratricopeptide repeat protein [Leptolyngbyaceae cyanobacterium C42_A2020_001]